MNRRFDTVVVAHNLLYMDAGWLAQLSMWDTTYGQRQDHRKWTPTATDKCQPICYYAYKLSNNLSQY